MRSTWASTWVLCYCYVVELYLRERGEGGRVMGKMIILKRPAGPGSQVVLALPLVFCTCAVNTCALLLASLVAVLESLKNHNAPYFVIEAV